MSKEKVKLNVIKLALLGDHAVGKTAICSSLMGKEFEENTMSTIGYDKLDIMFKLKNNNEIKVSLYDSAGQERFRSAALQYVKHVQGIIIVFDVTKRTSFDNIEHWLKTIDENFNHPNMILFGNKSDVKKELWTVTDDEIKIAAEKFKLHYFETSAKTKKNIHEGFSYLVNISYDKINERDDIIDINDKPKKEEKSGGCFGRKKKDKESDKKKSKKK